MNRIFHILGAVVGVGLVAVPAVSDALPAGKAKGGVQIVGAVLALLSSLSRAFGKA